MADVIGQLGKTDERVPTVVVDGVHIIYRVHGAGPESGAAGGAVGAPGAGAFGLRQGAGAAPAARRPPGVQGAEALVQGDAFGPRRGRQPVARQPERGLVQLQAHLVVSAFALGAIAEEAQPRHAGELLAQAGHRAGPAGVALLQAVELRQ